MFSNFNINNKDSQNIKTSGMRHNHCLKNCRLKLNRKFISHPIFTSAFLYSISNM